MQNGYLIKTLRLIYAFTILKSAYNGTFFIFYVMTYINNISKIPTYFELIYMEINASEFNFVVYKVIKKLT